MAIFQAWTITHSKIASKIRRGTHTRILSTVDIIPHSTRTHIYIRAYTDQVGRKEDEGEGKKENEREREREKDARYFSVPAI